MPKKTKLSHLNEHLFEQLERLNDDDLSGGALEKEVVRAKAMSDIAKQITTISGQQLKAAQLVATHGDRHNDSLSMIVVSEKPKAIT